MSYFYYIRKGRQQEQTKTLKLQSGKTFLKSIYKLFKKILIPLCLVGIGFHWYYQHYREQEIPMYSVKCTHDEYSEVIRWYLLKRKRKEEIPSSLYDGPWASEKFSLTSSEKQLVRVGRLDMANVDFFKFVTQSKNNQEILINRRTLELKVGENPNHSYLCEIRNPGEFWKYVLEKLKIKKAQLKI